VEEAFEKKKDLLPESAKEKAHKKKAKFIKKSKYQKFKADLNLSEKVMDEHRLSVALTKQ
jgi:hypothetical protein